MPNILHQFKKLLLLWWIPRIISKLSNLPSNRFSTRAVLTAGPSTGTMVTHLRAYGMGGMMISHLLLGLCPSSLAPDCPLWTQRQQIVHSDSQWRHSLLSGWLPHKHTSAHPLDIACSLLRPKAASSFLWMGLPTTKSLCFPFSSGPKD